LGLAQSVAVQTVKILSSTERFLMMVQNANNQRSFCVFTMLCAQTQPSQNFKLVAKQGF
jgi:hypothetical protein